MTCLIIWNNSTFSAYAMAALVIDYSPRTSISSRGEQRVNDLNQSLDILVKIFPQILPEVLREMLSIYDGDSRLFTIIDQLLKHTDQWVRGRWRVNIKPGNISQSHENDKTLLALEDQFRREDYMLAVRTSLCQEFKMLSKSTIDAVTAEQNHSYTRARPVLQQIAARSWRRNLTKLFSRWIKSIRDKPESHYMIQWPESRGEPGFVLPVLKDTGNSELDQELSQTVIAPLINSLKAEQESSDWALAIQMNWDEASTTESLYECECCFLETTFEQMATCTANAHILCFRCLGLALSEALYGQGWGRNIDHRSGQMMCLAPVLKGSCDGFIPRGVLRRAIEQSDRGLDQWRKLESRLADESLVKSQISLIRCPFCSYAEVNELYMPFGKLQYHLNTSNLIISTFLFLLALIVFPLAWTSVSLWNILFSPAIPPLTNLVFNSLDRLSYSKYKPSKFECKSLVCSLPSCISCSKLWKDPHICYESAVLSLRTAMEAARTAALKRTCPRCGLSFIKESGCNKLTCVCGYVICYLCRQHLSHGDGGEGYGHFCQHFRPTGGRCRECDRCDLYKMEDEDMLVKRAGELAEIEWRKREGMSGVEGVGCQDDRQTKNGHLRAWTAQGLIDWWAEKTLVC